MKYFFYFFYFFYLYFFVSSVAYSANLIEIYNVAVKNDPELLAAEANHKATMQEYPIARSYLLPNLNFSASSQRTRESIDGICIWDIISNISVYNRYV